MNNPLKINIPAHLGIAVRPDTKIADLADQLANRGYVLNNTGHGIDAVPSEEGTVDVAINE